MISHNLADLYDKNNNSPESPEKANESIRKIIKRKSL